MSLRRLLPILLLALALAPFGRMGAAEAQPMPHQAAMQMPAHCPEPPPAGGRDHEGMAIDCTIACAAMAPAAEPFAIPPLAALGLPVPIPAAHRAGIRPEADPPPPRPA